MTKQDFTETIVIWPQQQLKINSNPPASPLRQTLHSAAAPSITTWGLRIDIHLELPKD